MSTDPFLDFASREVGADEANGMKMGTFADSYPHIELSLKDLQVNDNAPRDLSLAARDAFDHNIATFGVRFPVAVKKVGDRWEIVCGNRRVMAAKKARFETISAFNLTGVTDIEAFLYYAIENLLSVDLNPFEKGELISECWRLGMLNSREDLKHPNAKSTKAIRAYWEKYFGDSPSLQFELVFIYENAKPEFRVMYVEGKLTLQEMLELKRALKKAGLSKEDVKYWWPILVERKNRAGEEDNSLRMVTEALRDYQGEVEPLREELKVGQPLVYLASGIRRLSSLQNDDSGDATPRDPMATLANTTKQVYRAINGLHRARSVEELAYKSPFFWQSLVRVLTEITDCIAKDPEGFKQGIVGVIEMGTPISRQGIVLMQKCGIAVAENYTRFVDLHAHLLPVHEENQNDDECNQNSTKQEDGGHDGSSEG